MRRPEDVGSLLVERIAQRGEEIAAALRTADLSAPSELPGWDLLTIACHLRFGAETLTTMTADALAGRPASYYPMGRLQQRPTTLAPRAGESGADVVESMATAANGLVQAWRVLDDDAWSLVWAEPPDNPHFGPSTLSYLPMTRIAELEVHGTDLGLGLSPWSDVFVETALPSRLERLTTRPKLGARDEGTWHLRVTGDREARWRVTRRGDQVEVERPARRPQVGDAVIEATARDLLAIVLGRPTVGEVGLGGDVALARAFSEAFPGP